MTLYLVVSRLPLELVHGRADREHRDALPVPRDAERAFTARLRDQPTEQTLALRALNRDRAVAALHVLQRRLALLVARGRGLQALASQVELDEIGDVEPPRLDRLARLARLAACRRQPVAEQRVRSRHVVGEDGAAEQARKTRGQESQSLLARRAELHTDLPGAADARPRLIVGRPRARAIGPRADDYAPNGLFAT